MGHDNATWLFKTPTDTYHSSESFWASLVGLYVLSVSSAGPPCRIPTYRYCEDTAGWWFEPDAPLVLSAYLQFPDVVVGGRLTHETFPRLVALPHDLANLKPDIIIQKDGHVVMIEVKTVGEKLKPEQKGNYETLEKLLQDAGYDSTLYFLISAGHEHDRDFSLLLVHGDQPAARLLLWEKILEQMVTGDSTCVGAVLGDVQRYFRDEHLYMRGTWPSAKPWSA